MKWLMLSDSFYINTEAVIFAKWLYRMGAGSLNEVLDVYLNNGETITLPKPEGEQLLAFLCNEVRSEDTSQTRT